MADAAAVATPTGDGGAQPEQQQQNAGDPIDTTAKADAPEPKKEEAPPPKTYKRKINGKEEEIPADAIDAAARALGVEPSELLSTSQLRKAAYAKFEEAERIRKQVEGLRGTKDPWRLAREMAGMDDATLDKMAEDRLLAKLQRESMDPAQRQLLEEREALAREKADLEADKKEQTERALTAQAQAVQERLEPAILDAAEKAGLPRTPDAIRAVVAELKRQRRVGLPLDPDLAAKEAHRSFFAPAVATLSKMTPEKIAAVLGKDVVDSIIRASLAQKVTPPAPKVEEAPTPKDRPRPFLTEREWKEKYGG